MIVSNERENALRTEKVLRRIAEGDVIVEEQVMRRGEIYHADLNPVFGSEQGGYRPVLIIQNNRGNQHSPTVIVAAITSQPKTKLPTHVPINGIRGLEKESLCWKIKPRSDEQGRESTAHKHGNQKTGQAGSDVFMPGVCKTILQFKGTFYYPCGSGPDNKGNVHVL